MARRSSRGLPAAALLAVAAALACAAAAEAAPAPAGGTRICLNMIMKVGGQLAPCHP